MRHPSVTQIHAYRGVGKTNVAFYLANALATKGEFLRWQGMHPCAFFTWKVSNLPPISKSKSSC